MNGTEVVASTGDPAFAVDIEGRIIAWNAAAEHCLGYRRSEILGRRCWRVLNGQDASLNRCCDKTCALRNMAEKGEPIHRTQMSFRNGAGDRTKVGVSALVVHGQQGAEIVHLLQCLSACHEEVASAYHTEPANNSNARLSSRQLEVLQHLNAGAGTEEIAKLLCISSATARHHIQKILTRLKVHSRLEAVTLARRIGII